MKNYVRKKLRKIFAVCNEVNVIPDSGDCGQAAGGPSGTTVAVKYPSNVKRDQDPEIDWELQEAIGDGSFGKVFKIKHREHGLLAAAKQCEVEDEDVNAFLTEIRIVTAMNHPNIVGFIDGYCFQDKLWLLLEYCDLGALDTIMFTLNKPLTEAQIACVASKVTLALNHLHKNNIIHRDVKCGNVLVTSNGEIKLADYGVSAINRKMNQGRRTIIGTPYWMAPEVFLCETENQFTYNYKIDIWSLGITMIECAEMRPPHHNMKPGRLSIKIQRADAPGLTSKKASGKLMVFTAQCLIKDPTARASTDTLLKDPFITNMQDMTPVRELAQDFIKVSKERSEKSRTSRERSAERERSPTETDSGAVMLSSSASSELPEGEELIAKMEDVDDEPVSAICDECQERDRFQPLDTQTNLSHDEALNDERHGDTTLGQIQSS